MNFRLPTLLCILLLAGCHRENTSSRLEDPARVEKSNVSKWMKTEVFFGRDIPGGGIVSDAEWTDFLDKTVTPQFPQGFTVTDAQGQYRDNSGTIVKERSKILTFICEPSKSNEEKIDQIRSVYKERFKQESVLKVSQKADVSF